MAVNKTKLAKGGEVGEVLVKQSKFGKFNNLTTHQKILVIVFVVVAVICSLFLLNKLVNSNDQATLGTQPSIQEVNQDTVNNSLKQLQDDPNSVPSGDFHPEKGTNYFRSNEEVKN